MRGPRPVRWLTFSVSAAVLLTGIVLLSNEAAGTGLAPLPDPDDGTALVDGVAPEDGDGIVVDRLDTWAETKGKKKASPVGKGKLKGNSPGRNRLR
jgi:hypothetical protein